MPYIGLLLLGPPKVYLDILFCSHLWPKSWLSPRITISRSLSNHGRDYYIVITGLLYCWLLCTSTFGHRKIFPDSVLMDACLSVLSSIGSGDIFLSRILLVHILCCSFFLPSATLDPIWKHKYTQMYASSHNIPR